jgi:hypothetical protein
MKAPETKKTGPSYNRFSLSFREYKPNFPQHAQAVEETWCRNWGDGRRVSAEKFFPRPPKFEIWGERIVFCYQK